MPSTELVLANIDSIIAAIAGLGTAAYGLVDASKAVRGGASNPGFGHIRSTVQPFLPEPSDSAFGPAQILDTLRANWLNGVGKAEQKAAAKALIRLTLTQNNAPRLAKATGVSASDLQAVADKIASGDDLTSQDINLLGQFDTVLSAVLDTGYERADQLYRNSAKAFAAATAIALALIGGGLLSGVSRGGITDYLFSRQGLLALLIGGLSVPLAPIAKDLSSALSSAITAVSALKRR